MTSSPNSRTVFFDLGNVLIFFSSEQMIRQISACTGLSVPDINRLLIHEHLQEQYETGRITSEALYRRFLNQSQRNFTPHEFLAAAADIFKPNLELWPLVQRLKDQGTKLVLVSNTNECHFNFAYSHFPILRLFDKLILSYEIGACKPHPAFFHKALQSAAGKTFYTDDIPAFIQAGRTAGLDAEIYTDVPTLEKHLLARNFL